MDFFVHHIAKGLDTARAKESERCGGIVCRGKQYGVKQLLYGQHLSLAQIDRRALDPNRFTGDRYTRIGRTHLSRDQCSQKLGRAGGSHALPPVFFEQDIALAVSQNCTLCRKQIGCEGGMILGNGSKGRKRGNAEQSAYKKGTDQCFEHGRDPFGHNL